jgi:hypothetical protein
LLDYSPFHYAVTTAFDTALILFFNFGRRRRSYRAYSKVHVIASTHFRLLLAQTRFLQVAALLLHAFTQRLYHFHASFHTSASLPHNFIFDRPD